MDLALTLLLIGKLAAVFMTLFVTILIGNATVRLTRTRMVRFTLTSIVVLVAANMIRNPYIAPGVGL
jgi:hypothetical protein